MKAVRDSAEDFYDPERTDNILERNKTRLELWEEHLKDPIVALDKALCMGESVSRLTIGSKPFVELVFNGREGSGSGKDVGQTIVGKCLALFGSLGQCAFTNSLHASECPKEVWTAR